MSLRKKIICGILLSLVVLIAGAGFLLRDNIRVVFDGLRYSAQELEDQLAQNDQAIKDAAQIVPDITIRDLTEEDKQALKDGTVTKEELVQSMIEPKPESKPQNQPPTADAPKPPAQEGQTSTPPEPQTPTVQVSDYQKQLAAIIAEVYVLREEFLIKLDNLMGQAKKDYLALAPEERSGTKLTGLVSSYFTKAYSLEAECDACMEEIITRMETLLKKNGGDLSIAQTVFDTYLNEKSLKKSWYMAELKKRGFQL